VVLGLTRLRDVVVVVMEVVEVELAAQCGQGFPFRQKFAELRVQLLQAKCRRH
jgi:hypothetical protein